MSKQVFGTGAVSGLNVGMASHLIEDHELTVSLNGWTDEEGCWKTATGPTTLYSGYSDISCFAAGRMGGADHLVWMDGNTLYDNGTSVGTITAGSSMSIKALDDGFLILGASKVYLYDGDHVRELGTWQVSYDTMDTNSGVAIGTASSIAITAIAKSGTTRITFGAAHGHAVGEVVYIDGGDMVEITGMAATITNVDTLYIDVAINSTNFTSYTAGGTAYFGATGLNGAYKWYIVPTVELSDGRVMLGSPLGLGAPDEFSGVAYTGLDAESFAVTPTDSVYIYGEVDWDSQFEISGTRGTDYIPGLRLYRTKDAGSDYYLEYSWEHGDADFTYSSPSYTFSAAPGFTPQLPDSRLGAVYTADYGDHDNPPSSTISTACGQRLYLASGKNLYWSHLDGIEFWNDLDYVKMPDTITALASVRGAVVIFSADRIWLMEMSSGLPDIREVDTPVGATYKDAMVTVDMGLLFLRTDGLWLFDGSKVQNIGRRAIPSIAGPSSVAATGDTLYLTGSSYSYTARYRDGGWVWHQGDGTYQIADASGGNMYASSSTVISKLFSGAPVGGYLTTKTFGGLDESRSYRVILDVEGESLPTVSINGVRQSDIGAHQETAPNGYTTRRLIRLPIPRLSNPFFTMTIATSGDLTVYGYWVEVER
jgi:hypothetical protein